MWDPGSKILKSFIQFSFIWLVLLLSRYLIPLNYSLRHVYPSMNAGDGENRAANERGRR